MIRSFKSEGVRFLFAGGINTFATYLLYIALLIIADYRVAFTSSFIVGIFMGYGLNTLFVFKAPLSFSRMTQYPLIYAFQYVSGLLLLSILVGNFGIDNRIAPLINVLLLTPITFKLNKWFLSRKFS